MLLKLNVAERNCIWYKLSVSAYLMYIKLNFCEMLSLKTAELFKACEPSIEESNISLHFIIMNA